MGKKHKLNRFIKWIKSDLPSEEKSPVLLLSITRIPSSPTPPRRPCSLPLRGALTCPSDTTPSETASAKWSVETASSRNSSIPKFTPSCTNSAASNATLSPSEDASQATSPCVSLRDDEVAASRSATSSSVATAGKDLAQMDRSVDSIGTCSLDVDASVGDGAADWSGDSSIGTLRSASILTPPQEKRLPSYLSLACTVNGYSTITNYDSCRLARSREVSPHRPFSHEPQLSSLGCTNTLSPPDMSHQEYFNSSSKTTTMTSYMTSKTSFSSAVYKESVDGCVRNGGGLQKNFIEYKSGSNGNAKSVSETSIQHQVYANGQGERKSFIQQRVERLYGPGALAQGFFVSKRQSNGLSESEKRETEGSNKENEQHSQSFKAVSVEDDAEGKMKQSTSSPALPVLRHLRPEFRAQLPIISPRKGEYSMQKSSTVPVLKDQTVQNGHAKEKVVPAVAVPKEVAAVAAKESEKDGHYFLIILEKETKRLMALADKAEAELEQPDLPEEAKGYLRSASGKAKLLSSQKMQQFQGLCRNNITQDASVQFPTTNEDLQGFWDMVLLQVAQVDKIFEELDVLRANGWQEVEKPTRDVTDSSKARTKVPQKVRPQTAAAEAARKAREAARKQMIEERRKAMRNQKQEHQSIEIFVPETS